MMQSTHSSSTSSSSPTSSPSRKALSSPVESQLTEGSNNKKHKSEHRTTHNASTRHHSNSTRTTNTCPAQTMDELQAFLDCSNMCIFGVNTFGKICFWNQQMSLVSGMGGEMALHQDLISSTFFASLEQQQLASNVLDLALTKGEATSNCKVEMITNMQQVSSASASASESSTSTQHFLWNVSAQRSNSGYIKGAICMAQVAPSESLKTCNQGDMQSKTISGDISSNGATANTTTTATDSDFSVSELKLLLDRANTLIFGIDPDGKVNVWNQKMAEITEFSREEAMHQPFCDTFVLPKSQRSVKNILQRTMEGKDTSNYELAFRTKSNEIRHLLLSTTTRRANGDASGSVLGVMAIAQDITEVALHDRASMNRELRQLVETANAPIFGIDNNCNVNEWNDKTAEITGFSKAEALHQPLVSTFIVPNLRESVQEVLDAALEGNETSNYQLEFRTKTNEKRHLLVNATTRRDVDSNIVGVVGVAQDVTDDRKHSEELRHMQYIRASQEAKLETERNMTAYFAHELRNPLHAIDSALTLMSDMPLMAESSELVTSMTQCASFMSSIMNNLLDVRKMEEGKVVLNKMPFSLKGLIERVRTMLLPSCRSGVTFLTHCNLGGKDWYMGDSHRIQQVLTNVFTNAIKYTNSGSIVVTVSAKDDMVRFECTDTGPGIPKQDQTKLFQRFVQRGGAPGTGLGLAIAKHLVDLTGGQIFFESDPTLNPGTTCVIEMPLQSCPQPSIANGATDSPFIKQPMRLLIVDDIRMNRTMFRRRFIKGIAPKAKITEAATGEEALDICKHQGFDVILMDQHMEEAGGVLLGTDTVVAMRRRRIDSIIIGCSGNDIDDQFMESGTDWVMKKPTPRNDVIVTQLRQLLARRQQMLEQRSSASNNSTQSNNDSNNNSNHNNTVTDASSTSTSTSTSSSSTDSEAPSSYQSVPGLAAPVAAPYVTDFSASEDVKRRLGLSVCPSFGPPLPHTKKKRKIV